MKDVDLREDFLGQPSDPELAVRLLKQMTKIDRIDRRGNIREHITQDGQDTLCGIEIGYRQTACGNAPCLRCKKIFDRLSETARGGGVMALAFALSAPPRSRELGFRIRCGLPEEEAREASAKDWRVAG